MSSRALAVALILVGTSAAAAPLHRPIFEVRVGGAYRYAVKESFGAAEIEFAVAGERGRLMYEAFARFTVGGSRLGLPFETVHGGGMLRWRLGRRVRLGFGLQLGGMFIERVTTSSDVMMAFTASGLADATVDLYRHRRGPVLFGYARLEAGYLDTRPVSVGFTASPSLGLGYRF
jgi:hypothetical protein